MNSGGRPSAVGSGPWTSYVMSASPRPRICVVVMQYRPPRCRKLIGPGPMISELPGRPEERGEEDRDAAHDQSHDPAGDVLTDEHGAEQDADRNDAAGGDGPHRASLDTGPAALAPRHHALRPLPAA